MLVFEGVLPETNILCAISKGFKRKFHISTLDFQVRTVSVGKATNMYEHVACLCAWYTQKMSHHPDFGTVGGSNPSTAG